MLAEEGAKVWKAIRAVFKRREVVYLRIKPTIFSQMMLTGYLHSSLQDAHDGCHM